MKETTDEHIRRVAHEIQELLVREKMALIPTLSLSEVKVEKKESPIIVPQGGKILTQEDVDKEAADNPLFKADFMQP